MKYRYREPHEMKDSGVKWLGIIPKKWEIGKIKYKFKIGRGRVISQGELDDNGKYPVYSSQTLHNGCLGYINSYDFSKKLITWTTDGANAGTIFLRDGKYNCTNVCGTLEALDKNDSLEYYFYYLSFAAQYYKRPDTNGAKIMNNEMANILSLIPSENKQKIVDFLNKKTSEFDEVIEKKEKLIEKLEEAKKSLISEVVTGKKKVSIDESGQLKVKNRPTEEMKNSGVEWLGMIPEEWKVGKIKFWAKLQSGNSITSDDIKETGKFSVYGGNGFRGYTDSHTHDGKYILIGRQGALCGNINYALNKFWASEHAIVVTLLKSQIDINWLGELLRSMNLNQYSMSAAQPGLAVSMIENLHIPFAKFDEQDSIGKFIFNRKNKVDSIIFNIKNQIIKLREAKQSLISEAVTGKIEVL